MSAPDGSILIESYVRQPPDCRAYDPIAADVARRVAALIQSRLPEIVVEHIGSTAVPGCAGKGVVDMMLSYPEGRIAAARDVLDALGFQRQTSRDPFPEERPMRTGSVVVGGQRYLLHVHVISASSPEVQELRCYRDKLKSDPALVAAYVAAKRAIIAAGCADTVDYAIRKGAFVTQVMKQLEGQQGSA
jgi:GrpB-like predicted nucleotidyltransferase (UPF0157 family)